MAISTFSQASGTTDNSNFYSWLNSHKSGTIFEDCTITNSTTTATNDTVTITDGTITISITARTTYGVTVISYTGSTLGDVNLTTSAGNEATACITGAILCDYGLILKFTGNYLSPVVTTYGYCITADNAGKLALLSSSSTIPAEVPTITSWSTYTATSTTAAARSVCPYYSANLTSLAPITAQGNSNNLYLPTAYAAISTQLSAEGLYAVSIDNTSYITNGVWYIAD